MQKSSWLALFLLIFYSCSQESTPLTNDLLANGIWRGTLDIGEEEIPFLFEVSHINNSPQFTFINGKERIEVSDVQIFSDSLIIQMPVFNSKFFLKRISANSLSGTWQNFSKRSEYIIPFEAEFGNDERFKIPENPLMGTLDHKWSVTFSPQSEDEYPAIGLFDIDNRGRAFGSFATETGDYRFLDGLFCDSLLRLSCFDGAHAFLFKATHESDGSLSGEFWSGHSWHEPWIAHSDSEANLSHPDSLTFLTIPDNEIDFSFRGVNGRQISLSDQEYDNKVILLQVFGSWCPNCADESLFYQELHEKYHEKGLEVIGLAFESSREYDEALAAVDRFRNNLGVTYDMAVAGYYSKKEATETLGFLNRIISFPTTVFIDRNGKVRRVHTGFYGPGTGQYYQNYISETEKFVVSML